MARQKYVLPSQVIVNSNKSHARRVAAACGLIELLLQFIDNTSFLTSSHDVNFEITADLMNAILYCSQMIRAPNRAFPNDRLNVSPVLKDGSCIDFEKIASGEEAPRHPKNSQAYPLLLFRRNGLRFRAL